MLLCRTGCYVGRAMQASNIDYAFSKTRINEEFFEDVVLNIYETSLAIHIFMVLTFVEPAINTMTFFFRMSCHEHFLASTRVCQRPRFKKPY